MLSEDLKSQTQSPPWSFRNGPRQRKTLILVQHNGQIVTILRERPKSIAQIGLQPTTFRITVLGRSQDETACRLLEKIQWPRPDQVYLVHGLRHLSDASPLCSGNMSLQRNRNNQLTLGGRNRIKHLKTGRNRVSMDEFLGKQVVVDVDAMYVYIGKLTTIGDKTLILRNADVHDLRDSTTTREVYVREARVHGIQPNRKMAHVRLEQVVSISLLDDIIP